jgi:hypothetical protein
MKEEDTKLALEPQWRKKGLKLLFCGFAHNKEGP